MRTSLAALLLLGSSVGAVPIHEVLIRQSSSQYAPLTYRPDDCPGYVASNVKQSNTSITMDLKLNGQACNAFSADVQNLKLSAKYETDDRLHLKIYDADKQRYEVPESVLPRPEESSSSNPNILFKWTTSPFAFSVVRADSGETLFDLSGPLVFEEQYLRVRTSLPNDTNLYGLGEHTDGLRLPTFNYTRTLWNRDAYGVPSGSNLYGAHPIYIEHRETGTHGVFLLNSNGMDININRTEAGLQYLEYNVLGGIVDMYFLAGSTPIETAKQYAATVGYPASVPYWGLGFHQCRYGYANYVDVANQIKGYAAADIPLETMWTDIDYMYRRQVFTLDPDYFPIEGLREVIDYLHEHDQHYIVMVDPAVASNEGPPTSSSDLESPGSTAYTRGMAANIFLKYESGQFFRGVVWPGPTVFPDWFNPQVSSYWTGEFTRFFAKDRVDIDGLWIDMNEPANFVNWIENPADSLAYVQEQAVISGNPPNRTTEAPAPGTPAFGSNLTRRSLEFHDIERRQAPGASQPLGGGIVEAANTTEIDYQFPGFVIRNAAGGLSNHSSDVTLMHYGDVLDYNVHNLYGTMMSENSRNAMLTRRPGLKTLVITRSTFSGAGRYAQKWLGDNLSNWANYRLSIAGVLNFASIYAIPVVGADVCGFGDNTTETLCARWASLGALIYPFYRNHNNDGSISQEFFRWPLVTESARKAIAIRYQLLDYLYTAIHRASTDGSPPINPVFYKYPQDMQAAKIDLQAFFGYYVLVSPVTDENSTTVNIYLPDDQFYDFYTYEPIRGKGANITLTDIDYTTIPLHIRGGGIIPMRSESAMTTTELRKKAFEILVAPGLNNTAVGELYLDDGVSLEQDKVTDLQFDFQNDKFTVKGKADYAAYVQSIVFLNQNIEKQATLSGKRLNTTFDSSSQTLTVLLQSAKMADGLTVELSK